MPTSRRLAIALLVVSLLPHAAFALSGPGTLVSIRPTRIDVKAAPGHDNVVLISEAAGTVSIADGSGGAALLQPTIECSAVNGVVTCPTRPVLRVKLGDGNDTLVNLTSIRVVAKGGSGDDTLYGGTGDDQLGGDSGNDVLYGREGKDELRGGTGDDVLDGGAGADRFVGQGGDDTVSYADPGVWPVVTRDRKPDDGEPNEGDNVLPSVEHVDVHPFNYRADDAVVARGGTLPVAAQTWPAAGDFDLETRPEVGIQALAYYDADGKMRVAARRIGETSWVHTPALATVHVKSWDQHRFMELAFDPDGRLHVIGNMHGVSIGQTNLIEVCCSPLQYFRTPDPVDDPADVLTLVRSTMVSPNVDVPLPFEDVTTYPGFFSDGERFFFVYRDGFSNGGEWYVHQLNRTTGQWFSPNGNQPWYSGVRNAAPPPSGFLNPQTTGFYFAFGLHDGRFWIAGYDAWLYASSCAATAVDGRCSMSWITTADFDHFHDVASAELQTPILPTNRSAAAVVDPAPYGGLWGSTVDFDEQGHPMLVYGRHAASRVNAEGKLEGNYQAYFARWNGSQWQRVQLSSWPQWTTRSPSLGVIPSIVGPVVDAGGVSHWYVRMTVFDEPPNTRSTGWLEIDLATLATTPAPSFQPPTTSCASGSTATVQPPVQYPDWIEPQNGIVLVPRIRRSNVRPYGLGEEAGAYYYLSWNATSAEPVPASVAGAPPPADPPLVALSVRRTTCVK